METFEKDGEFGFKRIKTVTTQEEQNFSIEYLKGERSRLVDASAAIQSEIDSVDALLAKAVELGIKETIKPSGESELV